MPKLLTPVTLTIVGIVLFLVWLWLGLSTVDYRPSASFLGLQTAGWF